MALQLNKRLDLEESSLIDNDIFRSKIGLQPLAKAIDRGFK